MSSMLFLSLLTLFPGDSVAIDTSQKHRTPNSDLGQLSQLELNNVSYSPTRNLRRTTNFQTRIQFENRTKKRARIRGYYDLKGGRKYFSVSVKPGQTRVGFIASSPVYYYYAFQPEGKKRWEGHVPMKIKTGSDKMGFRKLIRVDMTSWWRKASLVKYWTMPSKTTVLE